MLAFLWNRFCNNSSIRFYCGVVSFFLIFYCSLFPFSFSLSLSRYSIYTLSFVCCHWLCARWIDDDSIFHFVTLQRNKNRVNTRECPIEHKFRKLCYKIYVANNSRFCRFTICNACILHSASMCVCVWACVFIFSFFLFIQSHGSSQNTRLFWCICLSFRYVLSFSVFIPFSSSSHDFDFFRKLWTVDAYIHLG